MTDLITHYSDYDSFVREWHAAELNDHEVDLQHARDRGLITEDETRMLWQLLGELSKDELLIRIPEWLAEEKVGFVDGATPTIFVGRIDRETAKAIRFIDSASARPLMKLAHRIYHFEEGIENVGDSDDDRQKWLERRLKANRREFENRDDVPGLSEEWLPKSQLLNVVRRSE